MQQAGHTPLLNLSSALSVVSGSKSFGLLQSTHAAPRYKHITIWLSNCISSTCDGNRCTKQEETAHDHHPQLPCKWQERSLEHLHEVGLDGAILHHQMKP